MYKHSLYNVYTKNNIKMYSFIWFLELFIFYIVFSGLWSYIENNYVYLDIDVNLYEVLLLGGYGILSFWRYSVKIWVYSRAINYKFFKFKEIKARTNFSLMPKNFIFILTAFKRGHTVNRTVQYFLYRAIQYAKIPTLIYYMVSPDELGSEEFKVLEEDSKKILKEIVSDGEKCYINFKFFRQSGLGKRDAEVYAINDSFKEFLREDLDKSAYIMMDGDTVLPENFLPKVAPYLFSGYSALTTGNIAYPKGGQYFMDWLYMRFARRDIDCCSEISVLTGRFSMISGKIFDEEFARILNKDVILHPIYGKIRAKTGDDKTIFKLVKKKNGQILYVHDEHIFVMEEPIEPDKNHPFFWFFNIPIFNTLQNNIRYKGNMLLHALGYRLEINDKMSKNLKYKLLDQYLSLFTPLLGLFILLLLFIDYGSVILASGVLWILTTRGIESLFFGYMNGYWSARLVPYFFINQILESFAGIWSFINADSIIFPKTGSKVSVKKIIRLYLYFTVLFFIAIFANFIY